MLLPEPLEFLDLHDGSSVMLQINSWQDGSAVIHPTRPTPRHVRIHMEQKGLSEPPSAGHPIGNEVPVLRIFGKRLDEPNNQTYWDISSKRLRADLLARLTNRTNLPLVLTLSAFGHRPLKRYSVEQVG